MESINNLIQAQQKKLINSGLVRLRHNTMPYDMDICLNVMGRICKRLNKDFQFLPQVKEVYIELIKYLHADPAFKGDLTKGILLMGPSGTGKTKAMEAMNIYRDIDNIQFLFNGKAFNLSFEIVDVNKIISCFIDSAFDGIDIYSRRYALCLDDIGTEIREVKHFGNNLDVISQIIAERYTRGLLTFGTTNYPVSVLEQKYNDRIISRMYAMFNFITLNCQDFRKTKKI